MSGVTPGVPFVLVEVASRTWDAEEIGARIGLVPTVVFPSVAHGGLPNRRPRFRSADEDVVGFDFHVGEGDLATQIDLAGQALARLASSGIPDDLTTRVAVIRDHDEDEPGRLPTSFLAALVACRGEVSA